MRILHVIPYFTPAISFGGPVTACHDIAATQVAMGHEVTVLTTDALDVERRNPIRHEHLDGIEVIRFPNLSNRLSTRLNLHLPRGLAAWVERHVGDFDVVHAHDYFTYQNVIATRRSLEAGVPYVLQPHGVAAPPPGQKLYRTKVAFGAFWGRAMLRGAGRIIAVSEIERGRLAGYVPECEERIEIIGNGLRVGAPDPTGSERASLGLTPEHKVIVSLGRLHETKGFDRLLRAFALLVRRDDRYRLLIAGSDNGEEARLRELIRELDVQQHARLLGLVVGAQKSAAYFSGDVFALLSRYESFSIATIEAMAHGCATVLSKEVGVSAELAPEDCVVVASDADDAEATARQLEDAYAQRERLSARGREVAKRYDIRAVAERLLAVYEDARRNPVRTASQ